jgi:hypothetical protein
LPKITVVGFYIRNFESRNLNESHNIVRCIRIKNVVVGNHSKEKALQIIIILKKNLRQIFNLSLSSPVQLQRILHLNVDKISSYENILNLCQRRICLIFGDLLQGGTILDKTP